MPLKYLSAPTFETGDFKLAKYIDCTLIQAPALALDSSIKEQKNSLRGAVQKNSRTERTGNSK